MKAPKYYLSFILIVVVAGLFYSVPAHSLDYDHEISIQQMRFSWKVVGSDIHIKLMAKTTSWVGIGINPSKSMKEANFIIGYVKRGKVKVTDHFGTTEKQHMKDSKLGGAKNITQITGKEENGITEISFTIPLDSGDDKDQPINMDQETIILLAYGAARDSFNTKHEFNTGLAVDLKTGKFRELTKNELRGR